METKSQRIIFLDLIRALAVLMMVEGHTVDTLLGAQYRTFDSTFYNVWNTIRGFTAPIFMFTAGAVFTYLLRLNKAEFKNNPRVKKGFKRFLALLGVGYLLRFPTYKIVDFSGVTQQQWFTFFCVDALHLIAFGLLFVLLLTYLSEKMRNRDTLVFTLGALFFFLVYPFVETVDWSRIFPLPIAAYLYYGTGSLFPLFPWAGYVIAGAVLGSYLARNPDVYKKKNFSFKLITVGGAIVVLFLFFNEVFIEFTKYNFWSNGSALILYRIGMVLLLNGVMCYLSLKLNDIPVLIKQLGRNTFLIYVVHLVILYGSAWFPGMYFFYNNNFNLLETIIAVIFMLSSMIGMVIVVEKRRQAKRQKLVTAKAELST